MSKKRRRDCPAVNRAITAQECGENRGTKWACPAECEYFPFTPANYASWLELEDVLMETVLDRALGEMPGVEGLAFARHMAQIADNLHRQSLCAYRFFHQRDTAGKTMVDRWEAAGWPGLRNDLRHLLSGQRKMRPALLEVRGILDDQRIEVVDLFGDPEQKFTLIDRSMAATVARFATFLTWYYEMPHGARVSGGGLAIHAQGDLAPAEVIAELLRHLGAPDEPAMRSAWLAEHLFRVAEAYTAVIAARWEDAANHVDARYTKTEYKVRGRHLEQRLAQVRGALPEPPGPDEEDEGFDEGWVWLDEAAPEESTDQLSLPLTPANPRIGAGQPVLGRVLLGPGRARIEARSSGLHAQLRARFERVAGADATFVSERAEDLAVQAFAKQRRPYDAALIPPRLMENPQRLLLSSNNLAPGDLVIEPGEPLEAAMLRLQYQHFPDEPIPALGGITPRAASRDPALRPRLVQLMRTHVRMTDELCLREGLVFDLSPLLTELGLEELILPAPLTRAPLPFAEELSADEEAGFADDALLGELTGFTTAPPFMHEDEVLARLAALGDGEFITSVMERMEDEAGSFLLGIESRSDIFNDAEFEVIMDQLARAYVVLLPHPHPLRDTDRLDATFQRELHDLVQRLPENPADNTEILIAILQGPQPALVGALMTDISAFSREAPRKERPRKDKLQFIYLVVRAAIAALDNAIIR
jgi:hypothetical protein